MENNYSICSKDAKSFDASIYRYTNLKYISPVKPGLNQIPIIACSGIEWYNLSRETQIIQLEVCKFNVAIIDGEKNFLNDVIKAVGVIENRDKREIDLRFLVVKPEIFHPNDFDEAHITALMDYYDTYITKPCIAGVEFSDEPTWDDIHSSAFQNFYYTVEDLTYGQKTLYFNLIGSKDTSRTNNYELPEYLNEIQKIFQPMVWSFDHYPLSMDREILYEESEINGKKVYTEQFVTRLKVGLDGFYTALEAFLHQSQLTQRPFWYYCESVGYVNTSANVNRPAPSCSFLRFQVFNALAYGAKGIAYWTFRQRMDEKSTLFFAAAADYTNNLTSIFAAIKEVNTEILEYNDIFMNGNVMKITHVGAEQFPNTCEWDGLPFGPIDSISTQRPDGSNKKCPPAGVVMSHIATVDKDYLLVVSRDPMCAQFISIQFAEQFKVYELTPLANFKEAKEISEGYQKPSMSNPVLVNSEINRLLPGGSYMIFSWENR